MSQPSCSHSKTIYEIQLQKIIVLQMQPHHEATLTQPFTMRSAETELQNTIKLRATASEIVAPKPDRSRHQSEKKTILKHFLKGFLEGKLLAPKWRKSADKSLSQPSCSHSNTIYEVQLQKTIVFTNVATARSNLDAAIYTAETILQLQSTMEFHRQLIHQQHLQSHLHCGNDPRVTNHNGIPSITPPPAPLAIPFTVRERSLELQITMEFCRLHIYETQLKPHLQCGTDPSTDPPMIRAWPDHTRDRLATVAPQR